MPCPKVDFRSVYDFYLTKAPPFEPCGALTEVLADLLEPDYWKRLRRFGSLAGVAERLGELSA